MSENMNSHDYSASNQDLLLGIDCAQKILDNYKNNSELQTWLNNFISQRFTNNLKAFQQYFPNLAKEIENYTPTRPFDFFCDENGITNLIFLDNNDILYKCSNPIVFCQKQAENVINSQKVGSRPYLPINDPYGQIYFKYVNAMAEATQEFKYQHSNLSEQKTSPTFLFLGVGLGYQIAELCEKIEVLNLFIVEPCFDLFYASIFTFDWENFINYTIDSNLRINFILGNDTDYLAPLLTRYFTQHGKFLSSSLQLLIHYKTESTAKLEKTIYDNYYNNIAALGFFDDLVFGISHSYQAIVNQKNFITKIPLSKKFESYPVFIVGSGPSIDNDIAFIRKNQDKALIIACGTGLDTLYHAGIQADFYANTERTCDISQALEAIPSLEYLNQVILLCSEVCHPYTHKFFKKSAIFCKANEPLISSLRNIVPEFDQIQPIEYMNPLVGNMGVASAAYLGFKKIYLFGLDNGKKQGCSHIHSQFASLYQNRGADDTAGNYIITTTVDANFGGLCETNSEYMFSIEHINEVLLHFKQKSSDFTCFNCSDGALISEAEPLYSHTLDSMFSCLPMIDKEVFKQDFIREKTKVLALKENQTKYIINHEIYNSITNNIIKKLGQELSSRMQVIALMEEISELLYLENQITEKKLCTECINSSLQKMFTMVVSTLYSQKDTKLCLNNARKLFFIMIEFLKESQEIFALLPNYVMEEHRSYFKNGKVGRDFGKYKAHSFPPKNNLIKNKYDDPQQKFCKLYE